MRIDIFFFYYSQKSISKFQCFKKNYLALVVQKKVS